MFVYNNDISYKIDNKQISFQIRAAPHGDLRMASKAHYGVECWRTILMMPGSVILKLADRQMDIDNNCILVLTK
jgi:hypothetical protein